jgi:hypothetical protein
MGGVCGRESSKGMPSADLTSIESLNYPAFTEQDLLH